jgi:two-component system NtrC family sensor kinase
MSTAENVRRILVVEDEPAIADICQRILTRDGFGVEVAVNGRVAQEMILVKQYVLYLVDMRTPSMNGKDLYQWLMEKHPELTERVIFTTGDVMAMDIHSFLEETGRPLLPKPFNPAEVRAIVRETLDRIK